MGASRCVSVWFLVDLKQNSGGVGHDTRLCRPKMDTATKYAHALRNKLTGNVMGSDNFISDNAWPRSSYTLNSTACLNGHTDMAKIEQYTKIVFFCIHEARSFPQHVPRCAEHLYAKMVGTVAAICGAYMDYNTNPWFNETTKIMTWSFALLFLVFWVCTIPGRVGNGKSLQRSGLMLMEYTCNGEGASENWPFPLGNYDGMFEWITRPDRHSLERRNLECILTLSWNQSIV